MGKHHRNNSEDQTDIIAEVVDITVVDPSEPRDPGWHFQPMFRGFDDTAEQVVVEPEPVADELPPPPAHPNHALLIVSILGIVMTMIALGLAVWLYLHPCSCVAPVHYPVAADHQPFGQRLVA